ncbi:MAG: hypothetical protein J0H88_24615, partial [Sphingomonadales bacterium]|nr:hypothetical protein [Sphingomonadales bacterium]
MDMPDLTPLFRLPRSLRAISLFAAISACGLVAIPASAEEPALPYNLPVATGAPAAAPVAPPAPPP